MSIPGDRRRPQLLLLMLLAIALLLDRYLIADLFPWSTRMAAIAPMLVFLDIPLPLPAVIDLPVLLLFSFFYCILLLSYPSRYGPLNWNALRSRMWLLYSGGLAAFLCIVAGGIIFYLFGGLLSREVRNGIDSFGIQVDLYTPIPDYEVIHLRGGMILLACFFIGVRIFLRRTGKLWVLEERGLTDNQLPEKSAVTLGSMGTELMVEPGLAGFQEKERRIGEWGESMPTGQARTAATSVPVVAPLRVNLH